MVENFPDLLMFDENYRSSDPRCSMNYKHKKHEQNYKKEHQNKID